MASYPPPVPPPGSPYTPNDRAAWKYQRRMMRDQVKAQRDQARFQMRAMRRRSVLGPLLVVLVGVVFLLVQTGHLRSDRLWDWYGRWWPLLLVAGGVVLLIEWGVDQLVPRDPRQPYARRSIGGVVALVVLLSLAGALVHGIHNGRDFMMRNFSITPDDFAEFLGSKHESDQTLEQAFPEGGSLTIDNPHGDVTVTGTSTDGQIHLALHKQVYSSSDADAESKAHELSPRFTESGKLLSFAIPSQRGATADATLTVPATATIIVNANHGDVHIDSIHAPVTVTANHGDVALSEIGGAVVAHGNNGGSSFSAHRIGGALSMEGRGQDLTLSDIAGKVTLSGDFYGTTHLEHIGGAVHFHTSRTDFGMARLDGEMEISPERISGDQMAGPVVLTTRNRNISLDRISGELSVTNRNGTVDLTSAPPLGNVTVQNRNGSVTLTLPEHSAFGVQAETTDGAIQNDFSLPSVDHEQKAVMTGTVGKGGSLVRITTSQGDVAVRKASIAPLPPQRPTAPEPPEPPRISIDGSDGSSVYVGKDGVRILSGADGSSVIVGKGGLKITASADGSSVYKGKNGVQLTEGADGSKTYVGRNGLRYTESSDGSKSYTDRDGTRISIRADGSQMATGSRGKSLSTDEVQDRLRRAQDEVRSAEHERDTERNEHRPGNKND